MGEPSASTATRPSSIFAHKISGFSVVPTCLNSEYGFLARNFPMYDESGTPSMSMAEMRSSISFTIFSSAMPARYATTTAVLLARPTSSVMNRRAGVFRRRRMRLMLVFTSSMNPSRGPFTVMEVCGSMIARRETFLVPSTMPSAMPSMSNRGFPERISLQAVCKSSAGFVSGK